MFSPQPPAKEFDLAAVEASHGEFLATYLQISLGAAPPDPGSDQAKSTAKQMGEFMVNAISALGEVKRLYGVLESLQRKHLPMAGEPGAPTMCTGCSLHGAQAPWPCEVYATVTKALPERRP
jgi:hypothetical protein